MTYLRSSLAAAGHVQAPLAFTAFFLISQANFPPAFCLPRASPPLFLTFVSSEVGYSRRLRECGLCGGLGSHPAPNLAPPLLSSGRAAAASGAAGEPGGRESPEGAPGSEAPAGADNARQEWPACSGWPQRRGSDEAPSQTRAGPCRPECA